MKEKVFQLLNRATAGDGSAAFYLAVRYEVGDGVQRDMEKALFWYKQAVDLGDVEAMNGLANYHAKFKLSTTHQNQAAKLYQMAAELGHANAQTMLGIFYLTGNVFKKDIVLAKEWLTKASEQGNLLAKRKLEEMQ